VKYFGKGLSEKHKELNKIIRKARQIDQAKSLFLELHSYLHLSRVSNTKVNEVDKLIADLNGHEYAIMPGSKDETIAWALWHIARIEDLTMNFLVAEEKQLFDENWQNKMNVSITDTGNALSDDEIMDLSKSIDKAELINYRNAVGKRTRRIIAGLCAEDMKRRVPQSGLDSIMEQGGVTNEEESIWLLDFWKKKDVAGILLMPPTRHVILHLNDCCKWKQAIRMKKKYYLS